MQLTTDCFAPLATASCDISDALAAIADCTTGGKEYQPQVTPGGLCRLQGECIGGFCDLGAVKRPCGTGNCSAYLPTGTQCGVGKGQCDPAVSECADDGLCHKLGGPGSTCRSNSDCDTTSFCQSGAMGSRNCAIRKSNLPSGSSCDPGQVPSQCKAGDRCVQSLPATDFICITGKPVGAPCLLGAECAGTSVCVGADVANTKPGACQAQGKLGDSCNVDQGAICELTLYCSMASATCKAAGDIGDPCEGVIGGQSCLSGRCSAPMNGSGTCLDTVPDDSPCTIGSDCKSGVCSTKSLTCVSVCAPLL